MRLVDADALPIKFDGHTVGVWKNDLEKAPTIDAVPVVRCGECKYSNPIDTTNPPFRYYRPECVVCYCGQVVGDEPMIYLPTHFCGYGEKES